MTIEEMKSEMKLLQARVEQLGRELQVAEEARKFKEEVPEILDWKNGDRYYWNPWYLGEGGRASFDNSFDTDLAASKNHVLFKTKKFAEMYRERVQFIADLLHFKYLYDRDYEPCWGDLSGKYYVYYNVDKHCYDSLYTCKCCHISAVYFSSEEIAKKCVDWLNNR